MDKFFEEIKGCEILAHEEVTDKDKKKVKRFDFVCLAGAGWALMLLLALAAGWSPDATDYKLAFLPAILVMGYVTFALPIRRSDRWKIRVSREMSVVDFFLIKERFDLKRTDRPDVFIAFPKNQSKAQKNKRKAG